MLIVIVFSLYKTYEGLLSLKEKLTAPVRKKYTLCGKNVPSIKSMFKFYKTNDGFIR